MIPIINKDGGDYRPTFNRFLKPVQYPPSTVESIVIELGDGETFTKLYLSYAYSQLSMDEESAISLTRNIHKGLFNLNKMPYGAAPASSIFQKISEQ